MEPAEVIKRAIPDQHVYLIRPLASHGWIVTLPRRAAGVDMCQSDLITKQAALPTPIQQPAPVYPGSLSWTANCLQQYDKYLIEIYSKVQLYPSVIATSLKVIYLHYHGNAQQPVWKLG